MTLPLIEKYRATTFDEIKGQDIAINDIKNFFNNFPKKKAIILNGPAGTGKTSVTLALAKEFNMELFELNASDLRNRKSLDEVLKPASNQQSLFKKGKVILMDEADGITASDYGGLPELISLISTTSYPIIITANDIWQQKFNPLRKVCAVVNFKELKEPAVIEILVSVLKKENKSIKKETLFLIAKKSRGDVRSALNDLEAALSIGESEIINEVYEREKEEDIFNVMKKLFQSETNKETSNLFNNLHMELDEITLWIEENIPLEYKGSALVKAYDALSKADVYKGRIYRQQYWRFLVYQSLFLTAGISAATKIKYNKFIQYKRPSRILKIWLANQKQAKKRSVVAKYAKFAHMSKKKAIKHNFLLPLILDNESINALDLDETEQEYLKEKKAAIIVSLGLNKFRI